MEPGRSDKIIVVLGPTASGKSALAIQIAKEFDGEIISADSRQVFKGMDIGTGKVSKDSSGNQKPETRNRHNFISEGIVHHGLDIVSPKKDFNVSDFKKYAEKKIDEILRRGKLPIICGGTGFWIKAVVDGVDFPEVAPNTELRKKLEQKNTESLFDQLKKIDPERAKTIDSKNKIRLIRAIEICKALGSVPKISNRQPVTSNHEFLQVGIKTEKEILDQKIKKRLEDRFNEGMTEEVENLHKKGLSWKRMEGFGLEYRWIARYLRRKISLEEMKEKLYFDIIHYAKRQMTWFKKDKSIVWIEKYPEAKKEIENFLK